MSSQQQPLFPNSTPFSLDNYDNKRIGTIEGLDIQDDATLDTTMASLMTEYAKDTTGANGANGANGASHPSGKSVANSNVTSRIAASPRPSVAGMLGGVILRTS